VLKRIRNYLLITVNKDVHIQRNCCYGFVLVDNILHRKLQSKWLKTKKPKYALLCLISENLQIYKFWYLNQDIKKQMSIQKQTCDMITKRNSKFKILNNLT